MAYAPNNMKVVGSFVHKETNAFFEYSKTSPGEWGWDEGYDHIIHLTGGEKRMADVKKTVVHVLVDGNILESWPMKQHRQYEHSKIYDAKDVIDNDWSLDGLNPVGTITMEVEEE